MSKLLTFSGKKGSGKSTCFNYCAGRAMKAANLIVDFEVSDKSNGDLGVVSYNEDGSPAVGIFDFNLNHPEFVDYLVNIVYPVVTPHNISSPLKRFCVDMLGCDPNCIFGKNVDKNQLTQYQWHLMPFTSDNNPLSRLQDGYMSGREIMQFWAHDIFRAMDPDIHINAFFRDLEQIQSELVIAVDGRYPNEVEKIQSAGGKVIRLTRNVYDDQHEGEIALDDYPHEKFDAVIDNQNMTLAQTIVELEKVLTGWGW